MRLILNCTTKCNFSCSHCLRGKQKPKDLELNLLKKVLDEAKSLGFKSVGITGGEPCLHSDFEKMIKMIAERGFSFSFVTNGYYIKPYEKMINNYKKQIEFIAISLDGPNPETQKIQRGCDSFNRILKNIKKIKGKVYTEIVTCITKLNKHEIENIVKLAGQLNVNEIVFTTTISTSTNKNLVLSNQEKKYCVDVLERLRRTTKTRITLASGLYTFAYNQHKIEFCNGLNLTDITVNPYGDLIFCCDTINRGASLGSLKKHSLYELVQKGIELSAKMKKIRLKHNKSQKFFEGFDSCEFCNYYLSDLIR